MKLHLDKIHSININTWGEEAEIKFQLKQYKGIEFSFEIQDGELHSYGTRVFKKSFDGYDCELTKRQKDNCFKWVQDNSHKLMKYFTNECPETKLPLVIVLKK